MNTTAINKTSKDLNSFKVELTNTNLHTGSFGFIRDHALCFYPKEAMRVSDAVRQSSFFSGANDAVTVKYELETVEDGESGRFVVEDISLSVVPDFYAIKPFLTYELNYMAERTRGPVDTPELRRDGFNYFLNKFSEANVRTHYIGEEEDPEEGQEAKPAKTYAMVAAMQHLRSLLSGLPLSEYRLFGDMKSDNSLQLEVWSLDYKFAFVVRVQPGV